ncbi:MAG: hypothetical protein QXP54_02190 [Thermofilum sp.]
MPERDSYVRLVLLDEVPDCFPSAPVRDGEHSAHDANSRELAR